MTGAGQAAGGRPNVLNVSWTLDPVGGGGGAERTFQMSRALAAAGIPCAILTLDLGLTPARLAELRGVRVTALRCLLRRFYVPAFSYRRVRAALDEADIVHLMGHWNLLNAIVYVLVRRARKPYVICAAGTLPIFGRSRWLKRLYNRVLGHRLVRQASACIAITEDERAHFAAYGAAADRVVVIPNGISPEDYPATDGAAFRAQHGLGERPFVLFVGRLNRIKGPDLLLRAFCRLKDDFPRHGVVFAGPDEGMLADLRALAQAEGVADRVVCTGYLDRTAKNDALHAAQLVAIPSRQEAMSIVVLEAGMAARPVLVTDQCGCDGVLRGGGGLIVPATVDGLAGGLRTLLTDPAALPAMGRVLRDATRRSYAWDTMVPRYVGLYGRILRGAGV